MRTLVTVTLATAAFVLGVVATGIIGDQGKGMDLLPFVVGAVLAAVVAVARSHRTERATRES